MAVQADLKVARRRLRRDRPMTIEGLTLTPVVLEVLSAGARGPSCWLTAVKRPVAVIIHSCAGRRLLRLPAPVVLEDEQ